MQQIPSFQELAAQSYWSLEGGEPWQQLPSLNAAVFEVAMRSIPREASLNRALLYAPTCLAHLMRPFLFRIPSDQGTLTVLMRRGSWRVVQLSAPEGILFGQFQQILAQGWKLECLELNRVHLLHTPGGLDVMQALPNQHRLRVLSLRRCDWVTNDVALKLMRRLTSLQRLDLRGTTIDAQLMRTSTGDHVRGFDCGELTHLWLPEACHLTATGLKTVERNWPLLRKLSAVQNACRHDRLPRALHSLGKLTRVSLRLNCHAPELDPWVCNAAHLRTLRLDVKHCPPNLDELARLPELHTLDLRQSCEQELGEQPLNLAQLSNLTKLRHLTLYGWQTLPAEMPRALCQRLRTFRLVESDYVDLSRFNGGRLKWLVLHSVDEVEELRSLVSQPTLRHLQLTSVGEWVNPGTPEEFLQLEQLRSLRFDQAFLEDVLWTAQIGADFGLCRSLTQLQTLQLERCTLDSLAAFQETPLIELSLLNGCCLSRPQRELWQKLPLAKVSLLIEAEHLDATPELLSDLFRFEEVHELSLAGPHWRWTEERLSLLGRLRVKRLIVESFPDQALRKLSRLRNQHLQEICVRQADVYPQELRRYLIETMRGPRLRFLP